MSDDRKELSEGLDALEQALRKKKGPARFHARAILIALGRLELEDEGCEAELARLEGLLEPPPARKAWEKACGEELTLACTEHVQSVDARYLDHPRYDFEYTVAARERLEARLRAAELLKLEVDEALLAKVALADSILAPYLQSRGGKESLN